MSDENAERPRWAGRVPRHKIARLYEQDAKGIVDEDLIEEIGISFLARCESMMMAEDVHEGKGLCAKCDTIVYHSGKEEMLRCPDCGWEIPWVDYANSARHKKLGLGGIEPFIREYLEQYPKAKTPRQKMIQIDNIIHRYHQELIGNSGRPSAVNLIGGKVGEVMEFLTTLAYSDQSTPGLDLNYNRWKKRGRRTLRRLEKRKERARRKQEEAKGERQDGTTDESRPRPTT